MLKIIECDEQHAQTKTGLLCWLFCESDVKGWMAAVSLKRCCICFCNSWWWIIRYLLEVWSICSVVILHCRGLFWFEERSRGICPELSVVRCLLWSTASRYLYKLLKREEKREVFVQLHRTWKVNLEKYWLKKNVQSLSSNFKSVELYLCIKL